MTDQNSSIFSGDAGVEEGYKLLLSKDPGRIFFDYPRFMKERKDLERILRKVMVPMGMRSTPWCHLTRVNCENQRKSAKCGYQHRILKKGEPARELTAYRYVRPSGHSTGR